MYWAKSSEFDYKCCSSVLLFQHSKHQKYTSNLFLWTCIIVVLFMEQSCSMWTDSPDAANRRLSKLCEYSKEYWLKHSVKCFIKCCRVAQQNVYIWHIISCHLKQEKLNMFMGVSTQVTAKNKGSFTYKTGAQCFVKKHVWFPYEPSWFFHLTWVASKISLFIVVYCATHWYVFHSRMLFWNQVL
jgi:hypothetical protein